MGSNVPAESVWLVLGRFSRIRQQSKGIVLMICTPYRVGWWKAMAYLLLPSSRVQSCPSSGIARSRIMMVSQRYRGHHQYDNVPANSLPSLAAIGQKRAGCGH